MYTIKIFQKYQIKDLELKNRIVMPPMCMYSSDESGYANEFHFTHYVSRAVGGVGLIIMEATAVLPNGRITDKDLGLWEDSQVSGLRQIVQACHEQGSKIAIQLGHAGRKCTAADEKIIAPSAIPFDESSPVPHALTEDGIKEIVKAYKEGAIRADKAGFDAIEIHAAHGYLISEFLSPVSNKRTDEYGGNTVNRTRILREILLEIQKVWPAQKPVIVRVSADDYLPEGMTPRLMTEVIHEVRSLFDILHVSSGGVVNADIHPYPGYQVEAASYLRAKCDVPVIAVGLITQPDMAEEIICSNRADLVAIGRELLRNPYWVLNTAYEKKIEMDYPEQYKRGFYFHKQ
ncbi:NADPH dehydrogenase NamA [Anaerocolumna jejuensis]|uniref:NADPH dehydrogenase NamA n=1 Tax=Anaerocolumna jejuensis TaxID=259063 RepID=UPI003F7BF774